MYSSNFVISVLVNNKCLEENKQGIVDMAFNSEFVIRLRNKNKRDAVAVVSIDDENITGDGLIVRANSYVDLERPIYKNNNKFKFVSVNSGEAKSEGKKSEPDGRNGIIEVKWRIEKEKPVIKKG